MVAIKRFEDIDAWKAAEKMSQAFDLKAGLIKSGRLLRQMEDCCDSVMTNIAEGFDSRSDSEFLRFLKIAYRSASEFQSHLYTAKNRKYLAKAEFDQLYGLAKDTKSLTAGFMRYLDKCLKSEKPRRRGRRTRT